MAMGPNGYHVPQQLHDPNGGQPLYIPPGADQQQRAMIQMPDRNSKGSSPVPVAEMDEPLAKSEDEGSGNVSPIASAQKKRSIGFGGFGGFSGFGN